MEARSNVLYVCPELATLLGSRCTDPSEAIARAVFARSRIAVFVDVFSGLDKATEQTVFERVFGREGLLRQSESTVILSTHSGECIRIQAASTV